MTKHVGTDDVAAQRGSGGHLLRQAAGGCKSGHAISRPGSDRAGGAEQTACAAFCKLKSFSCLWGGNRSLLSAFSLAFCRARVLLLLL